MKYELRIYSSVCMEVPIAEKHRALIECWRSLDLPWALNGCPELRQMSPDGFSVEISLSKVLPKGFKGSVCYFARESGASGWRDSIVLEFDPLRIDYDGLVEVLLPSLVKGFSADSAYIANVDLKERLGAPDSDGVYVIGRGRQWKLSPVCFLSEAEIHAFYGLTGATFCERLGGFARSLSATERGVYFVGTAEVLDADAFEELRDQYEAALRKKEGSWWKWWR